MQEEWELSKFLKSIEVVIIMIQYLPENKTF